MIFYLNATLKDTRFTYKMNEIVNKFLLAVDKFMPGMNLKQPRFTYSASGPFTENKLRIKKIKKLEILTIFIKISLFSA